MKTLVTLFALSFSSVAFAQEIEDDNMFNSCNKAAELTAYASVAFPTAVTFDIFDVQSQYMSVEAYDAEGNFVAAGECDCTIPEQICLLEGL